MRILRSRAIALTVAMFTLAAILGSSLGLALADKRDSLSVGVNFVGGPIREDIAPGTFLQCLPQSSWTAVYIWKADTQEWRHFYNTAKGVPGYVNQPNVGGIDKIARLSGVALIMDTAVASPNFIDRASEACP